MNGHAENKTALLASFSPLLNALTSLFSKNLYVRNIFGIKISKKTDGDVSY